MTTFCFLVPSACGNYKFARRKGRLFSPAYSVTGISVGSWVLTSLWILIHSHHLICCSHCPRSAVGSPFSWLCVFSVCVCLPLSTCGTARCAFMGARAPALASFFLRQLCSFQCRTVVRNQTLRALLLSRLPADRAVFLFRYLSVSMCGGIVRSCWGLSHLPPGFILAFLLAGDGPR